MPHLGNPETDLLGLPVLLTSRAKATMARARSVRAEGRAFDGRPDPKGRRADCRKRYEFKFGYPTPQAAEKSNDDTNLTRAVTAYRFCYPTISMEATFEGPDKGAMILSGAPRQLLFVGSIEESSMQTLEADYFATYRNVKLSRDVKGVLVAEFHSYGGPFIMMGDPWRIPRQQSPHTSVRAGFVLAWFLATAGPRHDLTRSRARANLVT
jgi:hypothetical protein